MLFCPSPLAPNRTVDIFSSTENHQCEAGFDRDHSHFYPLELKRTKTDLWFAHHLNSSYRALTFDLLVTNFSVQIEDSVTLVANESRNNTVEGICPVISLPVPLNISFFVTATMLSLMIAIVLVRSFFVSCARLGVSKGRTTRLNRNRYRTLQEAAVHWQSADDADYDADSDTDTNVDQEPPTSVIVDPVQPPLETLETLATNCDPLETDIIYPTTEPCCCCTEDDVDFDEDMDNYRDSIDSVIDCTFNCQEDMLMASEWTPPTLEPSNDTSVPINFGHLYRKALLVSDLPILENAVIQSVVASVYDDPANTYERQSFVFSSQPQETVPMAVQSDCNNNQGSDNSFHSTYSLFHESEDGLWQSFSSTSTDTSFELPWDSFLAA